MLALLFPGQGSQEVGMGRAVAEASASAGDVFASADRALSFPLSKLCFEGPEAELVRTEILQPAILTTSIAILRMLEEVVSVRPDCVAGHSLGEYTALVAADAIDFEDAVRLVHARGRFMQEAVIEGQGAMAAVIGCAAERVMETCERAERAGQGIVRPANYNSPSQIVVAGDVGAVQYVSAELVRLGAKRVVPLAVSAPFHCDLMAPAAEKLAIEIAQVPWRSPKVPVISNVEALPNGESNRIGSLLIQQVTAPVRFMESVLCMQDLGVSHCLEVGPGRVLTGLVGRIARRLKRESVPDLEGIQVGKDFLTGLLV